MKTALELTQAQMKDALDRIEGIVQLAVSEERAETPEELATVTALRSDYDTLDEKMVVLEADQARRERFEKIDVTIAVRGDKGAPGGGSTTTENLSDVLVRNERGEIVTVRREPLTYEYGNSEANYYVDLYQYEGRDDFGIRTDPGAVERMESHIKEMWSVAKERATLSSNLGAIVTPQYLLDLYAAGLYNGRVSAMMCARYPLPAVGTSFTIPRITTKANTGIQAVQNTDVTESSPAVTDLVLGMSTVAGFVDMSMQAIDRGVMVESLVSNEVLGAYNEDANHQVLYGNGAATQQRGIFSYIGGAYTADATEYADATPTVIEFWQHLVLLAARVSSQRKLAADIMIMSPLTWGIMYSAIDADNRPLFQWLLGTSVNVVGVGDPGMANVAMPTAVGVIAGVPVVTDPALVDTFTDTAATGGTQKRVLVAHRGDMLLLENSMGPVSATYRATEAKKLTNTLVVYGYMSFTCERYNQGVAYQYGTGMALA